MNFGFAAIVDDGFAVCVVRPEETGGQRGRNRDAIILAGTGPVKFDGPNCTAALAGTEAGVGNSLIPASAIRQASEGYGWIEGIITDHGEPITLKSIEEYQKMFPGGCWQHLGDAIGWRMEHPPAQPPIVGAWAEQGAQTGSIFYHASESDLANNDFGLAFTQPLGDDERRIVEHLRIRRKVADLYDQLPIVGNVLRSTAEPHQIDYYVVQARDDYHAVAQASFTLRRADRDSVERDRNELEERLSSLEALLAEHTSAVIGQSSATHNVTPSAIAELMEQVRSLPSAITDIRNQLPPGRPLADADIAKLRISRTKIMQVAFLGIVRGAFTFIGMEIAGNIPQLVELCLWIGTFLGNCIAVLQNML